MKFGDAQAEAIAVPVAPNLAASKPQSFSASKKYIPALDGLRAVSISLVVASHYGFDRIIPGGFGVTVFFFISGFLITRLLLAEFSEHGSINIPNFYMRRFLRLAPAFLTCLAVLSIIYAFFYGHFATSEVLAAVFYFMNYYIFLNPHLFLPIRAFWSLAIEEHYYFIFPMVLSIGVRRLGRLLMILIGVAVVVLIWRTILVYVIHIDTNPAQPALAYTYLATDCRIDSILFGAFLSILLETEKGAALVRSLINWPVFIACTVLLIGTFLIRSPEFRETLRYTIQSALLLPMTACCIFGSQFSLPRRILEIPVIVWIGKISYSIYLWHFAILRPVRWISGEHTQLWLIIGIPLILIVASISYYGVERPIRSLRAKWR